MGCFFLLGYKNDVEGSVDVGENAAFLLEDRFDPFFHRSIRFSKPTVARAIDVYTTDCDDLATRTVFYKHSQISYWTSDSKFVLTTPNPLNWKRTNYYLEGSRMTFTIVPMLGEWSGLERLYVFKEYVAFGIFVNGINSTTPQFADSYSLHSINSSSPVKAQYRVKETGLYYFVLSSPQTDIPSVQYNITGTYVYYNQTEYSHRCTIELQSDSCVARIASSHTATKSEDVCVLIYVLPDDFNTDHSPLSLDYYDLQYNTNNLGLIIFVIICCVSCVCTCPLCFYVYYENVKDKKKRKSVSL